MPAKIIVGPWKGPSTAPNDEKSPAPFVALYVALAAPLGVFAVLLLLYQVFLKDVPWNDFVEALPKNSSVFQ
jgi:hypothetical protein